MNRLNKFEEEAIERYQKAISQKRQAKDIIQDISNCSEFIFKSICIKDYHLKESSYELREPVMFLYKSNFFSKIENPELNYSAIKHEIIHSDSECIRHRGNVARHEVYSVTKEDIGLVISAIKSILKWYFSEKYDFKKIELLPEQSKIITDLFKLDLEEEIMEERNKKIIEQNGIIKFKRWLAKTNTSTPQWTDYFYLPLLKGNVKRVKCHVVSTSEYFRFGFKLLRLDGKLFGDGSIQSQDNNFVIHLGKNFLFDELFITTYQNGIRQHSDKNLNVSSTKQGFSIELFIDTECFLHFYLNEKEIYKKIINKEIRENIYLLAWGDGNKYKVKVKKIEIEYCNE
ncbi:MAG: hypothetical protein NTZ33_15760 [Bacteroidetes bacterium]|nr:hypothetical protein [Bacteroidota bacterium]